MAPDTHCHTLGEETVVGSIDSGSVGDEYVIADISEDGVWLSMRAEEAPTLDVWR